MQRLADMSSGHCQKCGRRDVFCTCPSFSDTIAWIGMICILAAFAYLVLFANCQPKVIKYRRDGYDRPEILGPDPDQEYEQDRANDQTDDPDPIYDSDEEPT